MTSRPLLATCLLLIPVSGLAGGAAAVESSPAPRVSLESPTTAGEPRVPRVPISRRIEAYKTDIVEATGISKSGLHFILGGLAFALTGVLLIRFTPHWAWWAAGVTLSLALLLELVDWSDASLVGKRLTWGHALKDIALTCAVAAVFLIVRPVFDRLRR